MKKQHVPKPTGRPRKAVPAAKSPTPKPVEGVPNPPSWLSCPAKAEWRRAAAQLAERKVLTTGDLAALETFCSAKGRLVIAEGILAKEGLVVAAANGVPTKHPAVAIVNEASSIIKTLGAALGLTPASRRRAATEESKDTDDRWEGLVDG
jgi:P27 family predicted phage terminase small subunit